MNKEKRLQLIKEIISGEDISSQTELLQKLEEKRIKCTQATLSRNLRQLRVSRVPGNSGKLKYILRSGEHAEHIDQEITDIVHAVVDTVWAQNMMLVKTLPGYAAAVASHIDRSSRIEIAGTIAGDDTILLVPNDNYSRKTISKVLKQVLPGVQQNVK
ncbi:MAG: arginine repressor [Bacteroidota bacterium]